MLKKNSSGNISKNNLLIKKKSLPKLFISKSRNDLRTDKNYIINSKGKMQLSLNIEQNNSNHPKKYSILINHNINNEKTNVLTEKSININNLSEIFNRRNKKINFSKLTNKMKINSKEKLNIYNAKPKTPLLLNRNKNIKIFHSKNDKDRLNTNFYLPNQRIIINSDERRKSKILKERIIRKLNSEKYFKVKHNIHKNINIHKTNSFDILHKNISNINQDNNNTNKIVSYIKVNRNFNDKNKTPKRNILINKEDKNPNKNINSIYISKTLENNQNKEENSVKKNNKNKIDKNNKSNEYNIFLDKEYQERFIKKPKITKVKYDKFNSDKQKKYNTILVKKKNYNINNLTNTISSLSTSNSSQRKKNDWVYRLYNEEINKKKLENKIINSLRKSILTNATSMKQKNEIKIKENNKYDKYGNYKTFNTDNNFIINLINSKGKNLNQKRKLCLDKIINNNQRNQVQNKIKLNKIDRRYGQKKKKTEYLCNEDLIDEEDEEKEIDKEEN